MPRLNQRGISLIELMVAMVITVSVVVSTSIFFPRATQATLVNQQRMEAKNMASSKLEEIAKASYEFIPLTSTGTYFAAGCDCTSVNFSTMPTNATRWPDTQLPLNDQASTAGVTYMRQVCVNQVERTDGGGSVAYCPPPDVAWKETGLKNIRVRVSWMAGTQPQTFETSRQVYRQ